MESQFIYEHKENPDIELAWIPIQLVKFQCKNTEKSSEAITMTESCFTARDGEGKEEKT